MPGYSPYVEARKQVVRDAEQVILDRMALAARWGVLHEDTLPGLRTAREHARGSADLYMSRRHHSTPATPPGTPGSP